MKLLFDENISYRIVKKVSTDFPNSGHVSSFSLLNVSGRQIWKFALDNEYTIVTNDSDFNDLVLLCGFPPKVIWLKTGNTATTQIAESLILNKIKIETFVNDSESGILIIEQ